MGGKGVEKQEVPSKYVPTFLLKARRSPVKAISRSHRVGRLREGAVGIRAKSVVESNRVNYVAFAFYPMTQFVSSTLSWSRQTSSLSFSTPTENLDFHFFFHFSLLILCNLSNYKRIINFCFIENHQPN